jgi:peptide/nickel transport system substrate-binding protein
MPSSTLLRARRWTFLVIAGVGLAGCKGSEPTTTAAGPADIGGTLVISTPADAGSLLPLLPGSNMDREVTDLLYDRLADIGPDLITIGDKGFTPQLAERWEWAPDSLSIVFHLNPRARWHDGQPVRASDVRYSVATVKNPATGSQTAPTVTNVDSVSVRDSLTAVAWFAHHTPEQFYDLVYQIPIVPEHLFTNTPPAQLKTADVARRGIGSGRFRLARWEPGQRIELVADTGNYRGRPKLDRVVFSIAPDFAAAVTRFFAKDADMLEQLRPEHLARLAGDSAHKMMRLPNFQYAYLAFNLVDPRQPGLPNPIFGERAVRRALSMAVDRRAMLRNVFDTLGQPSYGPFPHTLAVADTTLPQLPYDTAKARALLDSAGWVMGPGAVRVKNGRRLEFTVTTPNSSAPRHAYAVLLQEAFRRIGASMKIEEADFGSFTAKQTARTFDAEMATYGTDPSVSGFKQSWTTAGIKDHSNFPSYSNPTVDALLDSATASFDFSHTRDYARRAFGTIIEDAPGIWLYEPLTIAGLDTRIHTTRPRADGYWTGLADWWIPVAERTARDKIGLRAAQ